MNPASLQSFQAQVLGYYTEHGRHTLPWRMPESDGRFDPYKILVSEIMLQQTQASRVIPKFAAFTDRFPTFEALAAAPLAEVMKIWSGLGYNRRAKFLWQAAGEVHAVHGGKLPETSADLVTLPGIGPNTAGAILAYAFGTPVVFIETNIRTVFIHHFFANQEAVHDRELMELVARALPDDSRTWYWALMDYGSHLKQTVGNAARSSAHYTRQSTFAGSRREVRGQVVRQLAEGPMSFASLQAAIPDERLASVLTDLTQEGLVERGRQDHYCLPSA